MKRLRLLASHLKIRSQAGYNHLAHMLIVLALLSIVGGAGATVYNKNKEAQGTAGQSPATETSQSESTETTADKVQAVSWVFDEGSGLWKSQGGTPPACNQPLLKISPVDMSHVTSILYPGQYRGGNYKAHGGMRFDKNSNTRETVKLPLDATLVSGARYNESGEIQYLLDFVNDCGIAFRFDHLAVLSPAFAKLADNNLPPPMPDDSRGTNFPAGLTFKAGDVLATAIGHGQPKLNVGLDFGVYDYRQPNAASKDPNFKPAGTSANMANFGICWLDQLPAAASNKALSLPAGDQQNGKTSDYCK